MTTIKLTPLILVTLLSCSSQHGARTRVDAAQEGSPEEDHDAAEEEGATEEPSTPEAGASGEAGSPLGDNAPDASFRADAAPQHTEGGADHCEALGCAEASASPDPSLQGCRGPLDTQCAVCRGPEGGYLHASPNQDWYNKASVAPPEGCKQGCPACASCSYREEQQVKALERRPECLPCGPSDDACFDAPGSCKCWCETRSKLMRACPTLFPDAG